MAARRSRTKWSQPRAFVSLQLKSKERGRISHVIDIMEVHIGRGRRLPLRGPLVCLGRGGRTSHLRVARYRTPRGLRRATSSTDQAWWVWALCVVCRPDSLYPGTNMVWSLDSVCDCVWCGVVWCVERCIRRVVLYVCAIRLSPRQSLTQRHANTKSAAAQRSAVGAPLTLTHSPRKHMNTTHTTLFK